MLIQQYILILILFYVSYCECNGKQTKKLQIGIKKRAQSCPVKSKKGDFLYMHYRGVLEDGTEFDNSYDRGEPFTFTLGSKHVIKGWEQGIIGMCVGEQRKFVIPPELAYGKKGAPPRIPRGATLTFFVELVRIEYREIF